MTGYAVRAALIVGLLLADGLFTARQGVRLWPERRAAASLFGLQGVIFITAALFALKLAVDPGGPD